MSFLHAVKTCFRKYATFSGRGSRREYWFFVLFVMAGGLLLGPVDAAVFGGAATGAGPLAALFSLATLLPLIAAGWRRMHDSGRTGLHLLYPALVMIGIVTFTGLVAGMEPLFAGDLGALLAGGSSLLLLIASVVLLISPLLVLWWLTRPSQPGANRFGPHPHEVSS